MQCVRGRRREHTCNPLFPVPQRVHCNSVGGGKAIFKSGEICNPQRAHLQPGVCPSTRVVQCCERGQSNLKICNPASEHTCKPVYRRGYCNPVTGGKIQSSGRHEHTTCNPVSVPVPQRVLQSCERGKAILKSGEICNPK